MHLPRVDRAAWRDALRLGLQSAAAAALSVLLMRSIGQPHVSWAVISALLVGQSTVDGTLAAVRGRLAGTLLGAVVGLVAVVLMPGEGMALPRLVLAAAVVSTVSGLVPALRYAAVVAAIICLEPGTDPLRGAVDRALAIGLGAAAGTACAWLVWPQRARPRALHGAQRALEDCASLLDLSLRCVLGETPAALDPLHRRFLVHIQAARQQLASMRAGDVRRRGLERTVHAVERLWHALIVLDRIASGRSHWQPAAGSPVHDALQAVRRHACERIRALSRQMAGSGVARDDGLASAVEDAQAAVREAVGDRHLDAIALAFALGEVRSNLDEIGTAARPMREQRGAAGGQEG